MLDFVLKGKEIEETPDGNRLVKLANRFIINIKDLKIDLIASINPFQRAYEILSNEINAPVLKVIQEAIADKKINMTIEEAAMIYNGPFKEYQKKFGNHPSLNDPDINVRRMAEALNVLKHYKIRREMGMDYEPGMKFNTEK